ncbi:mercuric reductase [Acidovorax sp. SRB_14]|uniref:mercuric reductase n=1 Tax=Acidovorax sp. SRB_14 TaxID=1962699 RepID=UPI00156646DB|nr:mercuric reductase [Acidovorax sp. SRB_14]NMM80187.1 mercuric reductase [Acidovorax sp. SRB_14]
MLPTSAVHRTRASAALQRESLPNMRPADWRNPPVRGRYDLLVIGAGPGGLAAARTAAAAGAKVALVERQQIGGNCINEGCIPSKTLLRSAQLYAEMRSAERYGVALPPAVPVDFAQAMARMRRVRDRLGRTDAPAQLSEAGIELYFGCARFVAPDAVDVEGTRLPFKKAVIATGSRAVLPQIEGLNEAGFLNNESVFDLTALPASLLVIGGGPLGCELAQAFARFGTRTVMVHSEPLFLPKEERDAAQMVSDALAQDGVETHLNCRVVSVRAEDGAKRVQMLSAGNLSSTVVHAILTGIGRRPAVQALDLERAGVAYDASAGIHVDDFLRTSNPRIYAVGDVCLEHRFTNTAEASAQLVVRNALFLGRRRMSALTIPWCTYTDPQVAHVGLYVRHARERHIPVKTFTVPMHDVDRAVTDSEEDGFVKIHVREGSDHILGATIVGRYAGEMINTVSLAMVAGIGLRRLAEVVHAYPTQGDAIRQAARACACAHASPLLAWLQRKWLQR